MPRRRGRAVYWTDMVVKADRPFRTLEDTFGGRIAFTAKDSHSGFNAVRRLLMQHVSARPDAVYSSAIGPLVTPVLTGAAVAALLASEPRSAPVTVVVEVVVVVLRSFVRHATRPTSATPRAQFVIRMIVLLGAERCSARAPRNARCTGSAP